MMDTDACIHPYPAGNSSVRRMAIEAGALGFGGIVVPGEMPRTYCGVRIIPAVLISETDIRRVNGQIRKHGSSGALVCVDARDSSFNRSVLVQKGVNAIRSIYKIQKNAFDHISARLAEENGIAVEIDLYPLIHERGVSRQRVLNRYNDLMRLQSRYQFPLILSSNACSVLDLRSPDEIRLLCSLFGMNKDDTNQALQTVSTLIAPPEPVMEAP